METTEEKIVLNYFDIENTSNSFPTILFMAKRKSGKSYTAASIARHFDVPRWAAWCGSKQAEGFYSKLFGSSATVFGIDERGEKRLQEMIEYQDQKWYEYNEIKGVDVPKQYHVGFIFDDAGYDKNFARGKLVNKLFSNGRHYSAVIIFICQFPKQVPPAVRANAEYIFMLYNPPEVAKLLSKTYVQDVDTETFCKMLRFVVSQRDDHGKLLHNSLVYDNGSANYNLNEKFYIYRTEQNFDIKAIRLGSPAWREFNRRHYRNIKKEIYLRRYKKRRKMQRLKRLQEAKARSINGSIPVDLDVYEDSDDEGSGLPNQSDITRISLRKGHVLQVEIPKVTESSFPSTSQAHVPYNIYDYMQGKMM